MGEVIDISRARRRRFVAFRLARVERRDVCSGCGQAIDCRERVSIHRATQRVFHVPCALIASGVCTS